jgi:hypothetical protein
MRKFGLMVALLLAGCGGGGKRAALGNGGGGGTLAAALTREVGAGLPVAIVPSAEGLRAVSADGARQRLLVPGAIRWAMVDNRADVVWFGTADDTTISVLDLAGPATPSVTPVVTGLVAGTDAGSALVTISYPLPSSDVPLSDDLTLGHPITPHVIINVAAEPSLDAAGGILEMWDQQPAFLAQVREAKLPGRALLATLAARGEGKSLSAERSSTELRVDGLDVSACEDPDMCGRAEEITPSLWRVVTSYGCGDGCYLGWQLYDAQKQAILTQDWAGGVTDVWVAPDFRAFISNGVIVRFDTGPVAATPASPEQAYLGGGWLGGGTYLP